MSCTSLLQLVDDKRAFLLSRVTSNQLSLNYFFMSCITSRHSHLVNFIPYRFTFVVKKGFSNQLNLADDHNHLQIELNLILHAN